MSNEFFDRKYLMVINPSAVGYQVLTSLISITMEVANESSMLFWVKNPTKLNSCNPIPPGRNERDPNSIDEKEDNVVNEKLRFRLKAIKIT